MAKNDYILRVIFCGNDSNEDEKVLYEGESYLKKNLSDHLKITESEIRLSFSRSKKIDMCQFLYTERSLYRTELQKSLCFYLAVQGEIPDVNRVEISNRKECIEIEHSKFSSTWKNCRIPICLDRQSIEVIFSDHESAENIYVMITYFLKAQLSIFSNDAFRSAWSGLNSIYRLYKNNNNREADQLKNFGNKIKELFNNRKLDSSIEYIESIPDEFYEKLDWYSYVNRYKNYSQYIDSNKYRDSLLLKLFVKYYKGILKEEADKINENVNQVKNSIKENNISYVERINFLIKDYCYMIRNRSFHGAKAYPVFVIAPEAETYVEEKLTKLLLYIMKDFIQSDKFI